MCAENRLFTRHRQPGPLQGLDRFRESVGVDSEDGSDRSDVAGLFTGPWSRPALISWCAVSAGHAGSECLIENR